MTEEYASIMKNDVWEVVSRPDGKSVVTSRWLYKIKHVANGSVEKFKARFVARGFSRVEGVNYEERFASVARYTSIRTMISIVVEMGWRIHQMDVKDAFLNGVIQEEVYIEQPEGFELHGRESHVCRLKKDLYGDNSLILALYVDDLFITGEDRLIQHYKRDLASKFDMTDMGLMHYFLGLEVWQEDGHIFVGQGRDARDTLRRFCMDGCRFMATPMITNWNWKKLHDVDSELVDPTLYCQLIGSLMYLVNTKPDICFADNTLNQFMMEPKRVHWVAAKHVLRYLQGTMDYGLDYVRCDGVRLIGCTDSNCASSVSDRKSSSRCCFSFDSTVVSWFSKKQKSVALSSAEAEYMAASQARSEALWFRKMLRGLFGQMLRPTTIYCDNQSCIKLFENPVFHDLSKYIEVRYHFIRD
eukprot:PITA_34944